MVIFGRPRRVGNWKAVTTTIPFEDWQYVKSKNLRFQHLLMAAIRDHKVYTNDENGEPSMRELLRKNKVLIEHRDKFLEKLQSSLDPKAFDEFLEQL